MVPARRRALFLMSISPLALIAPVKTEANPLVWLLRLIFGFGARRAVASVAVRSAMRGALARGAVAAGASRVLMQRAMTRAVSKEVAKSTRLKSALKQIQRSKPAIRRAAVGGGAMATSSSVSAMDMLDAGMLLSDISDFLSDNPPPENTYISPEQSPKVQVEVFGVYESDTPLNAILSVLIYDENVANGGDGLFHRDIISGTAILMPSKSLSFVHEFDVSGLPQGTYYIVPHAAHTRDPNKHVEALAFDPPAQAFTIG